MDDQGRVREVSWQELFPWLRIVSALRLAVSPSLLAFGAIGIVATIAGWRVIASWYDADPWPWPWQQPAITAALYVPNETAEITSTPFIYAWDQLSDYGESMFVWRNGWKDFTRFFLNTAWALIVWSLFGAAITRIAAVALARGDRLGFRAGLAHAIRRWPLYLGSPAIPLIGAFAIAFFIMIGGALAHPALGGFGDLMVVVGGIFWPLALLAGFIMALLLVGLAVGWPLMWATISVEATDPFDALSRSYSYAFHRPIRYLFYVIVAAVLGMLGWYLVSLFAHWINELSYWGLSWGATAERVADIAKEAAAATDAIDDDRVWTTFRVGASIIGFWQACLFTLAAGFIYSYFWSAATAIYYVLRKDEDGTEMSEVTYEEPGDARGLPPLTTDTMGVPAVSDVSPPPSSSPPIVPPPTTPAP
jgi:hypothetical protein